MAASENGTPLGVDGETESPVDIKQVVAVVDAQGDATATADDDVKERRVVELERECCELREKNEKLQRNLDDALSEICVAGCVKESLVELERQNASRIDEVATLQHLLNETSEEAR